jgi:predicted ATPase
MYLSMISINSEAFPNQGCYPYNIPVLRKPVELAFKKPVTFFVGENGSGKSTVLEAIARKCGIPIWDKPRRHRAHNNPHETKLKDYVEITWASKHVTGSLFRAETFCDFADFLDDVALCDPGRLQYHGGRILNTLSHGQGILSYLSTRFQIEGLYFLDEPEAALSPASQVKFLQLLTRALAGEQAQFIITTHSPLLLACPGAQVFSFDASRIREVDFQETEHYQLYKQFFADPASFLNA